MSKVRTIWDVAKRLVRQTLPRTQSSRDSKPQPEAAAVARTLNRKRALILHIGAHKTGTTAIQDFLERSRNSLAEKGWDVLDVNGVTNLGNTIAFRSRPDGRAIFHFHPHMLDTITKALAAGDSNKIISAEDLFFLNQDDDLRRLSASIKTLGFKVKIIVYLRNQVDMGVSNKAQGARTSQSALVFGNDKRSVLPELNINTLEYLNYHQKLEMWKSHFPDATFIIRKYDRSQLIGKDSVTDFVHICQLPVDPIKMSRNKTGGSKLTNLLHDLRLHGLEPSVAWNLHNGGLLLDDGGIEQSPSAKQATAFMAAFAKENWKIAQTYGIDLNIDCSTFPDEEIRQPDDIDFIYKNITSILNTLCKAHLPRTASTLRDSAIILEDVDLKQAYALMQIAHAMRPADQHIQRKLEEYKNELGIMDE